jgi:hypothetical protein
MAGLSGMTYAKVSERRSGWLGREDSNLRMVEQNPATSSMISIRILKNIQNWSLDASIC